MGQGEVRRAIRRLVSVTVTVAQDAKRVHRGDWAAKADTDTAVAVGGKGDTSVDEGKVGRTSGFGKSIGPGDLGA